MVRVTTDFEVKERLRTGEPKVAAEPEIKKYLKQSLMISKEIVWDELNITLDKEERYFGIGISTGGLFKRNERFLRYRQEVNGKARIIHTNNELQSDLVEALAHDTNNKYSDHFKVFYIDEATIADDETFKQFKGISYPMINFRSCMVFRGGLRDKDTAIHELLHAMGLRHSFDDANLFIFRQNDTDNIMDYDDVSTQGKKNSPDKLQLWKWQIDYLRENAKNNEYIYRPTKDEK